MIECLPVIFKKDFDVAVQNIKELVHVLRPDIDFDSCFSVHPYYNSIEMVRIMEQKKQLFENDFFETEEDMAFAVNDAILNGDIELREEVLKNLNLVVISYGFQSKATFTVSSVSERNIIICLQRIIKSVTGKKYEPQEFEVENQQNIDIHVIICLEIILLIYEKIQILVN